MSCLSRATEGQGDFPGHPGKGNPALHQGLVLSTAAPHLRDNIDSNTAQVQNHNPVVLVRSLELSLLQKGRDDAPHRGVLRPIGVSCRNHLIVQDVLRNEIGGVHRFTQNIQKLETVPGSPAETNVATPGCRLFGRETALFFGAYLSGQCHHGPPLELLGTA